MKPLLIAQYEMVLSARRVLLDYCDSIAAEHFVRSSRDMGNGGSMRNLLVHIANTYDGWLRHFAMGMNWQAADYSRFSSPAECRSYFDSVNEGVLSFLNAFENDYNQSLQGKAGSAIVRATPLELFTHVLTHEFHHKGQIMSLGRLWGYIPVDTDIIR